MSTLDTRLGHLLGNYMMALERRLPVVAEADLPRLTNAVGAMIAAAVAPSADRVAVARRQIDVGRKGAGATGRPPAPADPDFRADDSVPAYRNVSIQSLSAVRRHGRRGPVHSA
jgi:hypothetical protein